MQPLCSVFFFSEYTEIKLNLYTLKEMDYFVKTEPFRKAEITLETKNIVILTGHPGEGKTTLACQLGLTEKQNRMKVLLLKGPSEWKAVNWGLKIFDTVIIDNIFGESVLDQTRLEVWKMLLPEVEQFAACKMLRVIITTRHYILEECRNGLAEFASFKSVEKNGVVIHLTSKALDRNIRKKILKSQAEKHRHSIEDSTLDELVEASLCPSLNGQENFAFGFPECANMFMGQIDERQSENCIFNLNSGKEFFKNPAALFKKYLSSLHGQDQSIEKFIALLIVWVSRSNCGFSENIQLAKRAPSHIKKVVRSLRSEGLDDSLLKKIQTSLRSHVGGLLECQSGYYKFSHRVIGDMVGVVMGQNDPRFAVEFCQYDFFMKYISIKHGHEDGDYKIVIEEGDFEKLADKCVKMIVRKSNKRKSNNEGINLNVLHHEAFKSETFVQSFLDYVINEKSGTIKNKLFTTKVTKTGDIRFKYGKSDEIFQFCLTGYAFFSGLGIFAQKVVVKNMAKFTQTDMDKFLFYATHAGDTNSMRFLLTQGSVVTRNVLFVVVHKYKEQHLDILLQHGTNHINDFEDDENNYTPLMVASILGKPATVGCLLKHGANASLRNRKKLTALHLAVIFERYDVVRQITDTDKSLINITEEKYNKTPLHIAAELGYTRGVSQLIVCGADVKMKDDGGHCSIHLAAIKGNIGVVELLLNHDKSQEQLITSPSNDATSGMSLFHIAVWKNDHKLLALLADMNADPKTCNTIDCSGETALHIACKNADLDCVHILLHLMNADPKILTKNGDSIYHILRREMHKSAATEMKLLKYVAIEKYLDDCYPELKEQLLPLECHSETDISKSCNPLPFPRELIVQKEIERVKSSFTRKDPDDDNSYSQDKFEVSENKLGQHGCILEYV